jgi:hypothetical protein
LADCRWEGFLKSGQVRRPAKQTIFKAFGKKSVGSLTESINLNPVSLKMTIVFDENFNCQLIMKLKKITNDPMPEQSDFSLSLSFRFKSKP